MLVKLHHIGRMGDATVGHLGDMDETILMDADIDKGPEVGDVGDDARQDHAFYEVVDGGDMLVELEFLQLFARVAARLLQFLHDIREGRDAHLGSHILLDVDGLALLLVADQFADGAAMILGHLFDDGIALRVNGRVVEGILGPWDAEETCALLEGRRSEARYLLQLSP